MIKYYVAVLFWSLLFATNLLNFINTSSILLKIVAVLVMLICLLFVIVNIGLAYQK